MREAIETLNAQLATARSEAAEAQQIRWLVPYTHFRFKFDILASSLLSSQLPVTPMVLDGESPDATPTTTPMVLDGESPDATPTATDSGPVVPFLQP
jgi:hypothetical protein